MRGDRSSGRRWRVALAVLVALVAAPPGPAQEPEDVNRAIERGVDYLRSKQTRGKWSDVGDFEGGMTALCTLALLSCDVPIDDPVVKDGLEYLRGIEPKDTYVVALQTMVFAEVHALKGTDFPLIRRNADWLRKTAVRPGSGGAAWSYGAHRQAGWDNSNTQFALLGLWAASEAGVNIPKDFWEECRKHWVANQDEVGAWGYRGRGGGTGSMTAAGVSSLVIAGQKLHTVRPGRVAGQMVRCCGAEEDRQIAKGIDWLGREFQVHGVNPGGADGGTWFFYYLYGLERAGRLTGQRFLGDHDWYRAGVRMLLGGRNEQARDGSWTSGGLPQGTLYNTAFALLFLAKGRVPILINKLHYGGGDDWNNAPNDVHHMTLFMSTLWKKKLNWQIVDVEKATVEDLMQAPIIQFSGHEAPRLVARNVQLLRDYIAQGGTIVVDANCNAPEFDQGFRALCRELFPEPGQELRPLDQGHGVWSSLFQLGPIADLPLEGMDVACRTVLFYCPRDLSCHWEFADEPGSMPALRLGANIIAYATGPENLTPRLAKPKVFVNQGEDEIRRNFLQIAKWKHEGEWDPAPRAIANLLTSLRELAKVDVVRQPRPIDVLDPNLANYPLSYMHGRNRFAFTAQERDMIAQYLRRGGVLLADACCGSEAFDAAFRELVAQLFPDRPLQPIPPEHELFSSAMGYDLSKVEYSKAVGRREGVPALEGIEIDGRYVVVYSKYDLGCALERQQSSHCKGYTHDSAIKIGTNVVLYALQQ